MNIDQVSPLFFAEQVRFIFVNLIEIESLIAGALTVSRLG